MLGVVKGQLKTEPAVIEEVKNDIVTGMNKIEEAIRHILFSDKKLYQLSVRLDKNIQLLQNPMPQKIIYQHYVSKIIWIAAGLFIVLALVSSGWFITVGKLDIYIANDTKYRYLNLDTGQVILQKQLYRADSMFNVKGNLRKSVISTEEEYSRNFELLQKVSHMNVEAESLRVKAADLKKKLVENKLF